MEERKGKNKFNEWGELTDKLSLRNNWLKLKASGKSLIVIEESAGYSQIDKEKP